MLGVSLAFFTSDQWGWLFPWSVWGWLFLIVGAIAIVLTGIQWVAKFEDPGKCPICGCNNLVAVRENTKEVRS
jgi:uncharacterized membrane protein